MNDKHMVKMDRYYSLRKNWIVGTFPPNAVFFHFWPVSSSSQCCLPHLERFSYDLEVKTREQNRNKKRAEIERFDWFIERIQMRVAFGCLSERSAEKNFMLENFLEINRYLALTSYCNTIGSSNNAFSILGLSLAGKRRVHVLIFSFISR